MILEGSTICDNYKHILERLLEIGAITLPYDTFFSGGVKFFDVIINIVAFLVLQ